MAEKKTYVVPPVDIYQTDEEVVLVADMPGVSKDDLNIQIAEGELTIEADIPPVELGEKQRYVHQERRHGSYYLAYTLSDVIDPTKARAKVKDGVLTLTLGKRERAKPREIKIESVE